jgi:exonuclease 3'-5' domain-containing protein 1
MEFATRAVPLLDRRLVYELRKCVLLYAKLTEEELDAWLETKDRGRSLFVPDDGGSYEVFNERPLREEIRRYCVQDVHLLPRM